MKSIPKRLSISKALPLHPLSYRTHHYKVITTYNISALSFTEKPCIHYRMLFQDFHTSQKYPGMRNKDKNEKRKVKGRH